MNHKDFYPIDNFLLINDYFLYLYDLYDQVLYFYLKQINNI